MQILLYAVITYTSYSKDNYDTDAIVCDRDIGNCWWWMSYH